ncbi:MAG: hypothetical protein AAF957_00180 [Planctomycetota bacterium]
MDFLLECIGFPPSVGEEELVEIVRGAGEPAAWRGEGEHHRLLALGDGLEVRADLDESREFWTLTPHYRVPHRLRLAVTSIVRPVESPFDALLSGWTSPPAPAEREATEAPGLYRLSTWISDARRLDRRIAPGHVLALSIAGFAVHVDRVIPNEEVEPPSILERPAGAWIRPLGGPDDPGGCCDVSLRIRALRRVRNVVSREQVEIAVCDAPDRPILLFLSPWQLERDGLATPRPGWRIEGTFMFTGRIAGGLPKRPQPTFG